MMLVYVKTYNPLEMVPGAAHPVENTRISEEQA